MKLQAGLIIKSTAALNDTIFAGAIIFIASYNVNGAVGFMINQLFSRSLHELEEFRHSPFFPLYNGGPVNTEHLYFLHRRPDLVNEGSHISNGIYLGGNFSEAVRGINNKSLTKNDIKIFVGYCGWDGGELEAEIAEGSWLVTDEKVELVFD